MTETAQQIADAFATWQAEDEKFAKGNSAAGTRARKALQEITKLAKSRRAEISEEKTARKEAKAAA
jgi:hypothetical protein